MTRANGNRPLDDGGAPRSVSRPHRPLYRTVYPFRILGMGLSSLPVGVVLVQQQAGVLAWALLLFSGLLWPHMTRWRTQHSHNPERHERTKLLVNSAICAVTVPPLHLHLLPRALILTLPPRATTQTAN